ncbi:hypothetical protein A7Q09_10010 [Methylacidiphilum sp. Yel]|uniref:SOS response-associated peptidase n=1 Tax=Methylacidiphilum sp. Yel TaxID=1847730 RepID=UPI00106A0D22|nr:SOS response-associated peptidase [Methylacidiphilum sp. Yel]TFE66348.1 hypothetical protein A7Q09_10010 [Methylacidiphilum sp. Yel]
MCGRFSLRASPRVIQSVFKVETLPDFSPRYNIAPSSPILVIRQGIEKREALFMRWGLIPHWANEAKTDWRTINARAETVQSKPTFRESFRKRRCLIPADGFYEWQTENKNRKIPWYITLPSVEVFGFAGLWDRWEKDGKRIESATIIVTEACPELKKIHGRMPVIIDPLHYDLWLGIEEERKRQDYLDLLKPWKGKIAFWRVSVAVNRADAEGEELIKEILAPQ